MITRKKDAIIKEELFSNDIRPKESFISKHVRDKDIIEKITKRTNGKPLRLSCSINPKFLGLKGLTSLKKDAKRLGAKKRAKVIKIRPNKMISPILSD